MRRGRRHPEEVRAGDALDFWRVETVEPGRMIRLRAKTLLTQTAFFEPWGLFGLAYWYVLYVHSLILSGLIRRLAEQAMSISSARPSNEPSAMAPLLLAKPEQILGVNCKGLS